MEAVLLRLHGKLGHVNTPRTAGPAGHQADEWLRCAAQSGNITGIPLGSQLRADLSHAACTPYRDPFKFWASYLDVLPDETVLAGIDRHLELNRERLAYFGQVISSIEAGEHPMIQARAEQLEPAALERLKATRAMIFRELAAQARFEMDSAERIRQFWRELQRD